MHQLLILGALLAGTWALEVSHHRTCRRTAAGHQRRTGPRSAIDATGRTPPITSSALAARRAGKDEQRRRDARMPRQSRRSWSRRVRAYSRW
ncbi:hypothetical protein FXW78_26335 [Rhodococcus opacus]|nr:hypothetical protein [Rhodococcus opacus]